METAAEIEQVRQMAARLDCILEEDFKVLAGATDSTVESWRKRGVGPAYIRMGTRYFYRLEDIRKFMTTLTRTRGYPGKTGVGALI